MTKQDICRIGAGVLVAVIGAAICVGSVQLWNGAPASWPDVIAGDASVKSTAKGMMAMAVLLLVSGFAVVSNVAWGRSAAAVTIVIFVVAGFWANRVLFGSVRPMHTGPNVAIGALIVWLLWIGYSKHGA
jgi:hypothetical protein